MAAAKYLIEYWQSIYCSNSNTCHWRFQRQVTGWSLSGRSILQLLHMHKNNFSNYVTIWIWDFYENSKSQNIELLIIENIIIWTFIRMKVRAETFSDTMYKKSFAWKLQRRLAKMMQCRWIVGILPRPDVRISFILVNQKAF